MDTPGLRYLDKLKIGYDELQWLQAELNDRRNALLIGLARELGWVGDFSGDHPDFGWTISGDPNLVISTEQAGIGNPWPMSRTRNPALPFIGIDPLGRLLEVQATDGAELLDVNGDPIPVPADNTWRTLVARLHLAQTEHGTLALTAGVTTVVGTGTKFTRYSSVAGDPRGTIIRISGSPVGNDGFYTIATIVDDENMTLATPPPVTESGVPFRIQGQFFTGTPADPDIHHVSKVAWELVTKSIGRIDDGLVAYDVKNDAGSFSYVDRRHVNVFQMHHGGNRQYTLQPVFQNGGTGLPEWNEPGLLGLMFLDTAAGTGHRTIACSAAPCHPTSSAAQTGVLVAMLWHDGDAVTRNIVMGEYTPDQDTYTRPGSGGFQNPGGGGTVTALTEVGLLDCSLIALPDDTGLTHVLFYVNSAGELLYKSSDDDGATWSAAVAVWAPASNIRRIDAILTRGGRIIVAAVLDKASDEAMFVFSDDWLGTWDTNTNAGHLISDALFTIDDIAICEDDLGNLWTFIGVDDANPLHVFRGSVENDPTPTSASEGITPNGIDSGGEFTNARYTNITAFAMPGGQCGVFASRNDDSVVVGETAVVFVRQNRFSTQEVRPVVMNDAAIVGSNTDYSLPLGACVMANGLVFLGIGSDPDVGDNRASFKSYLFAPVSIERTLHWLGGAQD